MIEMLNTDCMEYMASLPDKAFDLAIVDPPYAVGAANGKFGNRIKDSKTSYLKNYANHDTVPDLNYFKEIFRVSKNWIVWGANYYPQHFTHTGAIIWHKKNDNPLSDCEIAFHSLNKLVKYHWSQWQGFLKGGESGDRIHPNQKPVALYKWLLKNYAKPGDKILDTHGGSGSICIACHDMGYDLTWMELDKDYYDAAVERYKRHASQGELFEIKSGEII